ncbi:unnamed protein product [Urochloa humidicola]
MEPSPAQGEMAALEADRVGGAAVRATGQRRRFGHDRRGGGPRTRAASSTSMGSRGRKLTDRLRRPRRSVPPLTSPPLSPLFNSVEERMMGFERSKESHLLDLTSLLDWATGETPLCSSRLQKKVRLLTFSRSNWFIYVLLLVRLCSSRLLVRDFFLKFSTDIEA